ncbi:MAG: T9SS type A sorting domain-containing protein [Bacteroidia bacterium]|nr:T9SS type A sorting domain-containing protein [Bacteroidia bacterium]
MLIYINRMFALILISCFSLFICNYINAQNPEILKDITSGTQGTNIETVYYPVDHYMFFINNDDSSVWRTDGTSSGTVPIFKYSNLINNWTHLPYGFIKASGVIFFAIQTIGDTVGLFTFTHSNTTPVLLRKFRYVTGGGPLYSIKLQRQMVEFNDKLYFNAADFYKGNITNNLGRELWVSDGTLNGTKMLKDINPGNYGFDTDSDPTGFVVAYGKLLFGARVQDGPRYIFKLYETDGTETGTKPYKYGIIQLAASSSNSMTAFAFQFYKGTLYIVVKDFLTPGSDLSTVHKLVNFNDIPRSFSAYKFSGFGFLKDKIVFGGIPYDKGPADPIGAELYLVDTLLNYPIQPALIKDIAVDVGGYGSAPSNFITSNNMLYFTAMDYVQFGQVWKFDLSNNSVVQVSHIQSNANNVNFFHSIIPFNNNIYFEARDSMHGNELYKLNPMNDSITYWDIYPGTYDGFINANSSYSFCQAGKVLYFLGNDESQGMEIWKIGNNAAGVELKMINAKVFAKVVPNPANENVYIDYKEEGNVRLLLFDVCHRLMESQTDDNRNFNISNFAMGIYYYKIIKENSIIGFGKLIVRH